MFRDFGLLILGGNNSYKGNLVFKMIQCFMKKVIKFLEKVKIVCLK